MFQYRIITQYITIYLDDSITMSTSDYMYAQ